MQKFTVLKAAAAPFPQTHVDTDKIIPARYMTTVSRKGLGKRLFAEARYDEGGRERPEFVLNQPAYRQAGILVAYENFGCGSSREHAPWALADFGIRCVIAPSFGDIFRANCLKNGILLVHLPRAVCEHLVAVATDRAGEAFAVDLEQRRITLPDGEVVVFEIAAPDREALLTGADEIIRSLRHEDRISAYEARLAGEAR
ncbi:3-isopropylmalate dehydratase small subunit [Caulobacter mirabilis]|uniref:3-isopropylmalate dehydratase small subunit n=1 Tax=Caulobacter mirabilis TaxID=69666 RepID=A0A2D2B1M4_9CAUL|nr:3-isopropylmalate dehydratase small subunit [Caulobacter mirabilis]ATQ44151.1 3-isopropylmalate dehydratase small subunit [Caulobacter mirabilis]